MNIFDFLKLFFFCLIMPSYPPSRAPIASFVMWGATVLFEWFSPGYYLYKNFFGGGEDEDHKRTKRTWEDTQNQEKTPKTHVSNLGEGASNPNAHQPLVDTLAWEGNFKIQR